ncbi:MAG: F0F1 ATP synthase subunit B [Dehalococcoidales bacterium]
MEGLGINVSTLIAQLINFTVLLVLLYLVAYKPILKIFDERSNRIKESIEQTESIKEQAASSEASAKKQIEAASKEGQEMVARAVKAGDEIRQKAKEEAKPEAEALISKARVEIQRERDEAIDELRKEVAELTISAAEKVIEQQLDKEAHRQLIDKVLAESEVLKKS